MEHAKKMVLLSQDVLDKIRQQQHLPRANGDSGGGTDVDPIAQLDDEINSILRSPLQDDAEKAKKYQQLLQRFLYFKNESRKPFRLDILDATTSSSGDGGSSSTANTTTTTADNEESTVLGNSVKGQQPPTSLDVVRSVPPRYQKRATLLYERLLRAGTSQVTWDKGGMVTIDGVKIPGSNIVDLVNDAMRFRKSADPVGRHQFARLLASVNIPQEYVGNQELWKYMRALGDHAKSDKDTHQSFAAVAAAAAPHGIKRKRTSDVDNKEILFNQPDSKKRKRVWHKLRLR